MTLQEQIKAGIGAHGMWKGRLKTAIETKTSDFSSADVRADDRCEFGKWLNGVSDARIKNSDSYRKCKSLHTEFHRTAAKVLDLALAGNTDAAKQSMAISSDFVKVSASLTSAMMDWSKIAQ